MGQRMPQFFVDKSLEVGKEVEITGRDAHHINDVLRLGGGDWLVLSDGMGRSFRAKITSVVSRKVNAVIEAEIIRRQAADPPALAFAVIKHDRSEWIIQKAVELGLKDIVPFYCERTIPTFRSADKKIPRWLKIAHDAAKQSGLPFLPKISAPVEFRELLKRMPEYGSALLFWEGERETDLRTEIASLGPRVLLIVGPEGGFSNSEIETAKTAGAVTVSLGQQILRVETAAIVAVTLAQYELGNLSLCKR